MKGILLVNMGGPQSQKEMKFFLKNMFCDKTILPFSKLSRVIISTLISSFRYKKSWKKYLEIGGTPIIKDTEELAKQISDILGDEYKVAHAFTYSHPIIKDALVDLNNQGITDITVVPLYPHYSISTWESVVNYSKESNFDGNLKFVKPFYKNKKYIEFFADAISKSIEDNNFSKPTLLFSAHSIPNKLIEKGDYYESDIKASAKLIADELNLEHYVSFQSQIGKKWLGPITEDVIVELDKTSTKEVLIVPISFVGENLETLYDIGKVIITDAKKNTKLNIARMTFSENQELLAQAIVEEVRKI